MYDITAGMTNGYNLGRQVGNDFATTRFKRAEAKLQQEIADRAKAEGKPIEDYIDLYRERVQQLAADKGVTRRAINVGDQSLEDATADAYTGRIKQAVDLRAGRQMAGGDLAGGMSTASTGRYRVGDLEGGMKVGQGADQIRAGQAAINPDGSYNLEQGYKGAAGVSAKYGDVEGAARATTARTAEMDRIANNLYARAHMLMDGTDEGMERAMGLINTALTKYDTRWGSNLQVSYDRANDTFNLYQGDPAKGNLVSHIPKSEARGWMEGFIQDPEAMLKTNIAARAADSVESRKAQRERDAKGTEAMSDLVKEWTKARVDPQRASAAATALKTAADKGWEVMGAPIEVDGVTTQQAKLNGELYIIQYGIQPDPDAKENGATIRILDARGFPVDPSKLQGAREVTEAARLTTDAINSAADREEAANTLMTGLKAMQAIWFGGGNPSAAVDPAQAGSGAKPGKSAVFTDMSGKIRTPYAETTNYVNSIMANGASEVPESASIDDKVEALLPLVIHQESGGNPNAVSEDGAKGRLQVMDATNRDPGYGVMPARDDSPAERERVGRDYLRMLLTRYDDIPTALAAYNAGPGVVDKWVRGGRIDAPRGSRAGDSTRVAAVKPRPSDPAPQQPSVGFMSGRITVKDIADFTAPAPPRTPVPSYQPLRAGAVDPRLVHADPLEDLRRKLGQGLAPR